MGFWNRIFCTGGGSASKCERCGSTTPAVSRRALVIRGRKREMTLCYKCVMRYAEEADGQVIEPCQKCGRADSTVKNWGVQIGNSGVYGVYCEECADKEADRIRASQ